MSMAPSEGANARSNTAEGSHGGRSAWHDNVRFVGICLVVAGHWGFGRGTFVEVNAVARIMIYSFHMALFAMLAGRFVKPGGSPSAIFRRSWGQLMLPLALFAVLDMILMYWITDKPVAAKLTAIPFGLWFLASLFCWRLMVTTLGRWRVIDALAGPVAIGMLLVSGLTPNAFSLTRTLAFFPAFLFGMMVLPRIETVLRRPAVRWLALVFVVAGQLLVAIQADRIPKWWLNHNTTYAVLGNEFLRGATIRAALMVFAIMMSVAVIALVSSRNLGAASRLGRYTLYAYLLHLPVSRVILYWLLPNSDNSPVVAVGVTLAIVPFTLLAMSAPVRRLTQPMVEPVEFVRPRIRANPEM